MPATPIRRADWPPQYRRRTAGVQCGTQCRTVAHHIERRRTGTRTIARPVAPSVRASAAGPCVATVVEGVQGSGSDPSGPTHAGVNGSAAPVHCQ